MSSVSVCITMNAADRRCLMAVTQGSLVQGPQRSTVRTSVNFHQFDSAVVRGTLRCRFVTAN